MATSIEFNDGSGNTVIANGFPAPGDRFRGWKPLVNPVGPMHHALGTGVPYKYVHRTDYGAKFELPYLPNTAQADCIRLMGWLLIGGSVTVTTGDVLGGTYTCYLWPESDPELSVPDPKDLRRVLSLSLLNSTESPMICQYP